MPGSPAHDVLRHVNEHTMCSYAMFGMISELSLDTIPERQIKRIEAGGELEQNRGRTWLVLANGLYVEVQPTIDAAHLGMEFVGTTIQQHGITIRKALEGARGAIAIVIVTYEVRLTLYNCTELRCFTRPRDGWPLEEAPAN